MEVVASKFKAAKVGSPKAAVKLFQAITLYGASDTQMVAYVRDHRDELHKMSGRHLLVILPQDVLDGNADWMTDVFDRMDGKGRYPGLRPTDLPCIWIEDQNGHSAVIRLSNRTLSIMKLMRGVVDACSKSTDITTFRTAYQNWLSSENERNAVQIELVGDVADATKDAILSTANLNKTIARLKEKTHMTNSAQSWWAIIFGSALLLIALTLVFLFPEPTQFQQDIIRIVLALAAAGFAVALTGFLEVKIGGVVKAGGALAVFVIVFFYNPAARLTADDTPTQTPAATTQQTDG